MSQQEMIGASKSLNLTITEILQHLGEDGADRPGPYDDKRAYLYEKLSTLMIKRYKQGFKRGHQEAAARFNEDQQFPNQIKYKTAKIVVGGAKRPFTCSSRIP